MAGTEHRYLMGWVLPLQLWGLSDPNFRLDMGKCFSEP